MRVGGALVLCAALLSTTARADELRVATLAPEGSAWAEILEGALRSLAEATDGRVTYKIYAGGAKGDERDVVRTLKLKELEAAGLSSVGLSLIYPGIRVLELPFLFESVEEVDYVRAAMWPHFEQAFADQGYVLLARADLGWSYMYSNRAIRTRADLAAVKMWAWQDDPIVRAMFKRMKLNGIPLGVPEVHGALRSGLIDACYGPPLAAVAMQWYTQITHASSLPVTYSQGAVVIRADALAALTEQDRAALDGVARTMGEAFVTQVRRDNQRALDAMIKAGIEVVRTPPALATGFEADAKRVWGDLAGVLYTEAELERVLEHRDAFRARRKKSVSN